METENSVQKFTENKQGSNSNQRSKETLKDLNKTESELIREQIGDIESIRHSLGLNKRRMCQLLLIDPSTWTRWSTGKTEVPPHIYRMLQWGLAVMDKYPEVHPLSQFASINNLQKMQELSNRVVELEKKKKTKRTRKAKPKKKGPFSFLNLKNLNFK